MPRLISIGPPPNFHGGRVLALEAKLMAVVQAALGT
jgi:hypothetical protein